MKSNVIRLTSAVVIPIFLIIIFPSHAGETFKRIKKRGHVRCGVSAGLPGFSVPDSKGKWKGIDVDVCRAFAAALFGDARKIKVSGLSAQQRFTALQSGEIDVLTRNTTYTLSRDTSVGLNFAPVNYYDGQGFMVKKSSGVKSAKKLKGASVCIHQGTTTERNVADFFRRHSMKFKPIVMESDEEVFKAFVAGRCDTYTTDVSGLAARRTTLKKPNDFIILPEIISKEPLAPAVRHGDDEWFDLVKWSVFAMISAEELGITSRNVDKMKKSPDPNIRRLLGVIKGNGKALGVSESWAYNIIKLVGNYGESFERNVGEKSPLRLKRGLNALWTKGGLMYAPPVK
ncbi:MAG: amino acid ABC transporter substrate-binding protein [Bacteriovoracales bacterium]|nr:amino acid ABC transporter substrate-binding protein [Bacteriovoracales bacterium]